MVPTKFLIPDDELPTLPLLPDTPPTLDALDEILLRAFGVEEDDSGEWDTETRGRDKIGACGVVATPSSLTRARSPLVTGV